MFSLTANGSRLHRCCAFGMGACALLAALFFVKLWAFPPLWRSGFSRLRLRLRRDYALPFGQPFQSLTRLRHKTITSTTKHGQYFYFFTVMLFFPTMHLAVGVFKLHILGTFSAKNQLVLVDKPANTNGLVITHLLNKNQLTSF